LNSIKSHLSLILALSAILISIFLFRLFDEIIQRYKMIVVDNYSIVIVSTKELKNVDIEDSFLIPIDIKSYTQTLQKRFKNLDFSNIKLPYFYKLKLNRLISPKEALAIKEHLLKKPYIKRVLTHTSSQSKIFNLLMIINIITKIFMGIISILGFLVIVKQLEVWKLMHSNRMYIMELFGAPFWFRGAALFKIALFDSIISLIIAMILIYVGIHSFVFLNVIHELNISLKINYYKEIAILAAVAFVLSLVSTIIVVKSR